MNKKVTITVGIPAYNEEANIGLLIHDVLSQKLDRYSLQQIIISSDGSNDKTVKIAKLISDSKILVIDNKDRKGIARGLNQIIKNAKGDILIFLDGDIRIFDKNFINKLIVPIINNESDLVSSAIKSLPSKSKYSKMLSLSMELKSILFNNFKQGSNIYNCYGLARALSKKFYKKLYFPVSIGNDMYSYLACINKGLTFRYVSEAVVFYKLPENIEDHKKQSLRFLITENEQEKIFDPKLVRTQTKIPVIDYFKSAFLSIPLLIKNPLISLAYLFILLYLRLSKKNENIYKQTWDIAVSSKGN